MMNPYPVIKQMHEAGQIGLSEEKYRGLQERAVEIAATDLDDDITWTTTMTRRWPQSAPVVKAPVAKKPVPKKAVARRSCRSSHYRWQRRRPRRSRAATRATPSNRIKAKPGGSARP